MHTTSDVYKRILARDDYIVRKKAVVNGVEYGDDSGLALMTKQHQLYAGDGPGIGGTAAAQYELQLHTDNVLPRLSTIELYIRLEGGGEVSEWVPKGTGYSSVRQRDRISGSWNVTGFDALPLAEQRYLKPDEAPGEWPRSDRTVVEDICRRLGVLLDERTVLGEYAVGYEEGLTMRTILSHIAAANAGNWTVTDEGKLYLVPFVPVGERMDLMDHMEALLTGTEFLPFSRIVYLDGDEIVAQAGDETGRTLEAECPWATQEMAENTLEAIRGYVYRPYEATQAIFDPAIELGDPVRVDGMDSVLATMETEFDLLQTAEISAPTEDAVESDFPFVNKAQDRLQQEIDRNQAILWTGIENADHLSTSKKISKYLLGDTSEDNFLTIRGLGITWIRARTDGTEVQATDIDGRPLYWDPDVEKAEVGVDGQFYIGTDKVKYTIVETPYPVMVYDYEEQVIAEWSFKNTSNANGDRVFLPTISMGAGYGDESDPARGKGTMCKTTSSFEVLLKTSRGNFNGIIAGDDYTDLLGMRQTKLLDLSQYDNGIITEVIDGDISNQLKITFDENDDPILVKNGAGHEMGVLW